MSFPEDLQIDKSGTVPVYRQIIEKITRLVQLGELMPGDRVPPERDLAESAGIARGTISKAYGELERNGIIESSRGKGSFVTGITGTSQEGRKEKALDLIDTMLDGMVSLDFSFNEIRNFVHIMIMEREQKILNFHFAAVDCNPEALSIFENQLLYVAPSRLHKFLLDEVKAMEAPEETFENFNIILTTTTHYQELAAAMPAHRDKIIQAAVAPSQQTVIDLASLRSDEKIGIVCYSEMFNRIIRNRLEGFQIDSSGIETLFIRSGETLDPAEFLEDKNVLIVPPDLRLEEHGIALFSERNGRIIHFQYQIERGSLIYIEEHISKLLN
jgi:DNA-binding transcriptional regulator YhcF (GntR family)